jgi:Flp pilus assembly protein TadB
VSVLAGAAAGGLMGLGAATGLYAWRAPAPVREPLRAPISVHVDRLNTRLLGAFGGAVMATLTRWPAAIVLGAIGGFAAPSLIGRRSARARALARTEGLAAWSESLRDLIGAGSGIESTITESARLAPPAIRAEVQHLAQRLANNEDLDVALRAFADEIDDPLGDLVVTALATAAGRQGGANLGGVLGAAATAARAQVAMRHQVEATRAGTYASAKVVVTVFVLFAVGLLLFNRSFLDPFDTAAGQVVLIIIGGLFALCAVAMVRLAEPTRPARFFRRSRMDGLS